MSVEQSHEMVNQENPGLFYLRRMFINITGKYQVTLLPAHGANLFVCWTAPASRPHLINVKSCQIQN